MSMTGRELVKRAIEFESPEHLPFWQHVVDDVPDDVCDCWEMDRARAGWFFDRAGVDDWGCVWERSEVDNMGQVKHHPLGNWGALESYRPPDARDSFYFERLEDEMRRGGAEQDKYVVITCHFNLVERLHMLRGFEQMMLDFYLEPEKVGRVLDMVLEFKVELLAELHRRLGDRVHGVFFTDDWGSQQSTFVSGAIFDEFFAPRYRQLNDAVHGHGYHSILHSCGRVNDFVQRFLDCGFDVLNMQQPRTYGIEEIGRQFAGKAAFLTTVDIQRTLPRGSDAEIRGEAQLLLEHWATPQGGFIVFNYGDGRAIGAPPERAAVMFHAFLRAGWPVRTPARPHAG